MDKALRKELKTDDLAVATGHALEYVAEHKTDYTRYGIIAAVVLLAIAAGVWYFQNQAENRRLALSEVLAIREGTIGAEPVNGAVKAYATEADKEKAFDEATGRLITQYSGSEEAAIAEYYRGVAKGDKGDLAAARKAFEAVANSSTGFAYMGKYSLAGLHMAEGRPADAAKLLREVVAKPSPLVSKDQATLDLARALKDSDPAEARKLLEPLRGGRGSVARTAVQLLAETEKKK